MENVRVQFIGSGDAFGSGGRLQTCLLVRGTGGLGLVDCGATALVGLKRFGVEPAEIERIVISHLHGDHFGGLPFFLLDAQLVTRRERPLVIAGPPGLVERVRAAMEALFPGSSGMALRFPLEYVELPAGERVEVGDWAVTPYEVVHASGAPAYGLRVDVDGRVIAYSGDTEWIDTLIPLADGADLFICEAYMFDKRVRYHLSYRELAERRDLLRCRRIVLTHMSADLLARRDEVEFDAADDGLVIEL